MPNLSINRLSYLISGNFTRKYLIRYLMLEEICVRVDLSNNETIPCFLADNL